MSLKKYIAQRNVWRTWAKKPLYDIATLTRDDVKTLLDDIDCDLSPENLCCDGELRGQALYHKKRLLDAALSELRQRLL